MPFVVRRPLTLATAMLALLAVAPATHATTCFQDTAGRVVVVQGSSSAGKGKCRLTMGHVSNSSLVLRGVVCENTAGTTLRFGFDYSDSYAGILGTYAFAVNRGTLAGSGYIYTAGSSSVGFQIARIECPAVTLQ